MKRHRKHAWFSPSLSLESTKILDFQLKELLNRLDCQSKATKNCFWVFVRPLSCTPDCSKGISAARSGGGFLTKKRSRLTRFKKQCLSPPYSFFWAVSGAGGVFAVASPPGRRRRAPRPLGNARIISTHVESRLLQTSSKLEKEEVEVKGERKKFFFASRLCGCARLFPTAQPLSSPPLCNMEISAPPTGKGGGGGGGKVVCGHGDDMGPASRHQGICLVSLEFFAQHETAEKMVHGGGREHNANSAQKK